MAEFKKREARKANFLKKIFNGDQSTKTSSFVKRKPTLMKKAKELETLCGIEVCIVCFDPNGNVDFWPKNEWEVKRMCSFYLGLNNKEKKELDYFGLMQSKKKKLIKKKANYNSNNVDLVIKNLCNWVDGLSGDALRDSVNGLEVKIKNLKKRIELLKTRTTATATDDEAKCFNGDNKDWFCPIIDQNESNYCYYNPTVEYKNKIMSEDSSIWVMNNKQNNSGINDMVYGLYQNPVKGNYIMQRAHQINMLGGENFDYTNFLISSDYNQTSTLYDVLPISQLPYNF